MVRPVKELKEFKKVMLQPGESQTITFAIDKEKISFYISQLLLVAEPEKFKVMIGGGSDDIKLETKQELLP